jgi:hypothetical protein
MTAKGYQYYQVEQFPSWELGNKFETQHQDSMLSDVDESPRTVITTVGLADNENFRKYHALHETYQKVRGRYKNQPINGFIAQMEFHLYYHPQERILFVDAQRHFCKEMVERLHNSNADISVRPDEINLVKLGNDLRQNIRGGWFGDLKVADVSTIGIFGSTVGESEEWLRYEQIGKLKAIDLRLQVNSMELLVKIMANRGIVIFENYSEALSLKFLLEIQKELDNYRLDTPNDDEDDNEE